MTVLGDNARAAFIGPPRRRIHPMRALRLAPLASLFLLLVAGPVAARGGMPTPLTDRGRIIEDIYYQIFVAGLLVFLFVMALLVFVIIRYRASSGHGRATFEHERDNLKLEMTWIVIPLFIMLWIGFISYAGLIQLDEGYSHEDGVMEIEIVGQKWFWSAAYDEFTVDAFYDANGVVDQGAEFYVPAGVPVTWSVTGADVIHSFSIQGEHANGKRGPVFLTIDANPTGPHKINKQTMVLPEGVFHVQCREMCFNPGHGYMRAKIVSVEQAEYDAWYAETLADLTAPKLNYAIELDADGMRHDPFIKTAPSSAVRFQFANNRTTDVTFTSDDQSVVVPAGALVTMDVLPLELGDVAISSDAGDTITLNVVQPKTANVELGDFYISPSGFQLEAGELYEVTVTNVGGTPHNLFIGDYAGPDVKTTLWSSATINGDMSTTFLVLPTKAMMFDTWCDVPGHAGAGMLGSATAA